MAKDPAAVALGKKRQAAMTDDERKAFAQLGAAASRTANAGRTREERRAIVRKGNRTRRLFPKWARMAEMDRAPGSPGEPGPVVAGELAQLGRAIEELPQDVLEKLVAALAGR